MDVIHGGPDGHGERVDRRLAGSVRVISGNQAGDVRRGNAAVGDARSGDSAALGKGAQVW